MWEVVLCACNPLRSRIIEVVLNYYLMHTRPNLDQLRWACVHSDLNPHNIIVRGNSVADFQIPDAAVAGVIDYGDATFTHLVNNVAICVAYICLGENSVASAFAAAAAVVAGYHRIYPLTSSELVAVFPLSVLRVCVETLAQEQNAFHGVYKYCESSSNVDNTKSDSDDDCRAHIKNASRSSRSHPWLVYSRARERMDNSNWRYLEELLLTNDISAEAIQDTVTSSRATVTPENMWERHRQFNCALREAGVLECPP
jgi:Ser/Thr protein kinase RdoA (MazF antagonist)